MKVSSLDQNSENVQDVLPDSQPVENTSRVPQNGIEDIVLNVDIQFN